MGVATKVGIKPGGGGANGDKHDVHTQTRRDDRISQRFFSRFYT